jgi:hypothetical protein|tara:strand:- start:2688 stop:2828 length:141 start_codon:yes stop_codon:yes gene_type:complete
MLYFLVYFSEGGENMDDNSTIKQGAFFVLAIGFIVFLLGLGAFIFY